MSTKQYCLIALDSASKKWDECYAQGIIAIGFDELGDFAKYNSINEVEEELKSVYKSINR